MNSADAFDAQHLSGETRASEATVPDYEPLVVLLPSMPHGVFLALQYAMKAIPLVSYFNAGVGSLVEKGTPLVSFGGFEPDRSRRQSLVLCPLVAPFAGRLTLRSIHGFCGPEIWRAGQDFPGLHAFDTSPHVAFGIQPLRGARIENAVISAYTYVIDAVRDAVRPQSRNPVRRLFAKAPHPWLVQNHSLAAAHLALLCAAKARIGPLDVDIDNYFGNQ